MNKIFMWIRRAIRALLIFIVATSALGVTYWVVEHHSIRDLIAFSMVALGWIGIGYAMCKRSRPSTRGEW